MEVDDPLPDGLERDLRIPQDDRGGQNPQDNIPRLPDGLTTAKEVRKYLPKVKGCTLAVSYGNQETCFEFVCGFMGGVRGVGGVVRG